METTYNINHPITVEDFASLLERSTLGERRPADQQCLKGMIENSNLVVSAWHKETLVGIARSVTDFHYACYLSDLAVDQAYQGQGIGKALQVLTQKELGPHCKLILLAAPDANDYYPKVGYTHHPRCWVMGPQDGWRHD